MRRGKWKRAAVLAMLIGMAGCHANQRQDTVLSWVLNPSHTWRATIVLREYFIDGHADDVPTTYVLLDRGSGPPHYESGADFSDTQVVIKPTRCGPLTVKWLDDKELRIICDRCGLSLAAVGAHPSALGPIRVDYEGFPERSSWEQSPAH